MALATGPLRPAYIRLSLLACAAISGCHGCDDKSTTEVAPDGSVDAGPPDGGMTTDPIPGERPVLSDPGDIVPLLWGRVVEVRDESDASDQRFALDDPTQPLYQRFFLDLNAACAAELSPDITAPGGALVLPGCGQDGAYQARLHLCRAEAASTFVAGDGSGLVRDNGKVRLKLPESQNAGEPLWSTLSTDNVVRASWAMLAVAELREAVASASDALDPETCEALDDDLAIVLAEALRTASDALPSRTQSAAGLLQQARLDVHNAAVDEPETRIRVTRALNHSLLEQQKLYTGVPYALFSPLDPGDENQRSDRYPVLFEAEESTLRAATLLLTSQARFLDEAGQPLMGEGLAAALASALRVAEPKLFGQHAAADANGVLSRLGLTLEQLDAGALHLSQRAQLTGAPIAPLTSLDATMGLVHLYDAERAPEPYVEAITGARATRVDDKLSSYARRGLHHALEAARLAAEAALTRSALPPGAEDDLTFLSVGSDAVASSLRICEREDLTQVDVQSGKLDSASSFEFWQGELGAACAIDPSCDAEPYRAPNSNDSVLGLTLSGDLEPKRYYVTRKGPGDTRELVGSFSTAPLDASEAERCFYTPLSTAMHESMRGLHDRNPIDSVPRTAAPLQTGTLLEPSPFAPVTTGYGRALGGKDALGEDLTLDLGEPLSEPALLLRRALDQKCAPAAPLLTDAGPIECGPTGFAHALAAQCRLDTLREAATGLSLPLPELTFLLVSDADRLSLRLLAWDEAHHALAMLGGLFDSERCEASQALDATSAASAIAILSKLVADTESELSALTAALEAEASAKEAAENDPYRRRVGRVRGVTSSSLATARLLVSPPSSAYEPALDSGLADPLDFAFTRFPVVTRDAELAEDARAEGLLRQSRLQPWLSDLTVQQGRLDPSSLASAYGSAELATRLRTALVAQDEDVYGPLPADSLGFLQALGITQAQLIDAAVRVAQTAEIRGLSLLPEAGTAPLTAQAMGASFPAPQGHALSALSGGKLAAAVDAAPQHFALRGHYHALAYVQHALRYAQALPAAGSALLSELSSYVGDQVVLEQLGSPSSGLDWAVELTVDGSTTEEEARLRYALAFGDTGLACALSGAAGGESCAADAYTSFADTVSVLAGADGSVRRLRLDGFSLTGSAFDSPLSREQTQGRVYLIELGAQTAVVASAAIGDANAIRHVVPRSSPFEQRLLEILSFRAPGEGCAACRPRSVCETTRCELDLCIREPEADGKACTATGMCVEGECNAPGCGDGARSDGSDGVSYEACDDGNLDDDDGCSASCLPELRALEPVIEEGFPAGPATAIGIDGLGQQLLVYTADALVGDNQLIRAAVLDSFGVQSGSERTLDAGIPRVFIAEPCVAGLRDGGFAVVYGSPNIDGKAGLGVRIVSPDGDVGTLLRVDESNATAGTARVASVEDGFVVVWSERSGNALSSRVRARRFDSQGNPIGASFAVASASTDVDQVEPTVISSLGQILVVWSERDNDGGPSRGIRGRRFFPFGSPVDADAFVISAGDDTEPALTVLASDDYLVAFTSRDVDPAGDIERRPLRRFGLPLSAGDVEPWVEGAGAQARPVIAGLGDDAVLAYQAGSPLPITALRAGPADVDATDTLASALASARERDVSAFSTPLGVWFVWSERQAQGRALFAYLLPQGQ